MIGTSTFSTLSGRPLRFLAQSHKLAVSKMAVRRPFDELELPHELRLYPPTFLGGGLRRPPSIVIRNGWPPLLLLSIEVNRLDWDRRIQDSHLCASVAEQLHFEFQDIIIVLHLESQRTAFEFRIEDG